MDLMERLMEQPIIGAISTYDDVHTLLTTSCEVFFILSGDISTLQPSVEGLMSSGKMVFVHMDLIHGLKGDSAGLMFLLNHIKPTGIISTKGQLIKEAKNIGLFAIQRIFLLDSKNMETGLLSLEKNKPDAVEILPGALHKVTKIIVEKTRIPVITGGLILDKEDIINCLKVGAVGVSVSNKKLWSI